jgi:pSer/pThr/pTyr-binding forkhead associated (FHA) protein
MFGKLVPCGGGPPVALLKPKLLVGRQDFCDVALRFPSVSSRHCQLELTDGYWLVRDLNSSNGTRVNGVPCVVEWLLPNDILGVSKYRYSTLYSPPPGRSPPRGAPAALPEPPPAVVAQVPAAPATGPPTPSRGPPLGRLIPCGGGPAIPLLKPRLVVGRRDDCDIVLRNALVSGRHCILEWSDGGWSVRDLSSRNGTRVNGAPCETAPLAPGDVLWVAGIRFEAAYSSVGSAARPQLRGPLFSKSLLEKAGLTRTPRNAGDRRSTGDDGERRKPYTLEDE